MGVYRHPDLVAPEDTLDGVDPVVEDLITGLAAARWRQGPGSETQRGLAEENRIIGTDGKGGRVERIHAGKTPMPQERMTLGPLDRLTPGVESDFGTLPDTVTGA